MVEGNSDMLKVIYKHLKKISNGQNIQFYHFKSQMRLHISPKSFNFILWKNIATITT